jgi:predicted ATPase/DNA-binding CsgD family transcriptional regulator
LEAAAVRDALATGRLVTLTGPGGVGKSRLAVRVAGQLASAFPDGVFFADLSAATDTAGVLAATAAALGLAAGPTPPEPGWLARALDGRRLLLILDTCEHVIDACAAMTEAILHAGGGPVLLATSRQTLDLPGEVVLRIPPLPVDGDDAERLFADRAAAACPGFQVTQDTLPRLTRLCRLLDGMPLAIELAALRLRAINLDELLARLPGQQLLLAGGRRSTAGGRQRSLAASVDWSYQLCSPAEQRLWACLSVFADGFDLAAAEAVCGPGPAGLLAPLVGLVDKSVLLREADTAGGARYRLLAVVREHGAAHAADAVAGSARHRAYYLNLVRAQADPGLSASGLARLAADENNLHLAFQHALAAGDAPAAVDLAAACWPLLLGAGDLAAASTRLSSALGQEHDSERAGGSTPTVRPVLTARVLSLDRVLAALRRGEFADCAARGAQLEAALPAGERWARGWAAWAAGTAAWCAGDQEAAAGRLRAGLELLAPPSGEAASGEAVTGEAVTGEAVTGEAGAGGEVAVAQYLEAFGWLAAGRGEGGRTARLQGAADRVWRRLTARAETTEPRFGLMPLHAERDLAERRARAALGAAAYEAEHTAGAGLSTVDAVACALLAPDGPLLGDLLAADPGAGRPGPGHPAPGASPPSEGSTPPGEARPEAARPGWEVLTPREREVAALIAAGLTNKDIAARLVVSKRTVDAHVEHILGKLGYSSRLQVASLARRNGPGADPAPGPGSSLGKP